MSADNQAPGFDLTNCNREPIHIPGAVQPHGAMVVLDPHIGRIVAASANAEAIGIDPQKALGKSYDSLPGPLAAFFRDAIAVSDQPGYEPSVLGQPFLDGRSALVHRHDGWLIVEVDLVSASHESTPTVFSAEMARTLESMRSAASLQQLCDRAARSFQRLTQFDRVVVYRFDESWHGNVLAESRRKHVPAYLGLNFPASDIPAQARELYRRNPLRYIPVVAHEPVPLLSTRPDPVDMSHALFRAVSPIHLEYLRNMGVHASMSVPLKNEDRLWGLLSCTHESGPLYLSASTRAACDLIGQVMSSLLTAKEALDEAAYRVRLQSTAATLLQYMTQKADFVSALVNESPSLLDIAGASGAAVYLQGQFTTIGEAPSDTHLHALLQWLRSREEEVLVTDSLPTLFPDAMAFKDKACGLIAAALSKRRDNFLLWFRPEVLQTVNWGGNPQKSVSMADGRLHPRRSFELWKETVKLKSLPWKKVEREAASEFRSAFIDIVLQRAEEISKLNVELARSNLELDSFAYAASHDLKEPLRGIQNYSVLVARELASQGRLDDEIAGQMTTISQLTQRMESLIDSLLHYSQVGKTELSMREVDLSVVLAQILEMLRGKIAESHVEVRVPRPLPKIRCDGVRTAEVLSNLITNAIKYNDKPDPWVEIGYADGATPTFYVRDNGIGIRAANHEKIFRIFKRLHAKEKFGGGAGTGLTITKRIVERHQGHLWLDSVEGKGSTFYFQLGPKGESP